MVEGERELIFSLWERVGALAVLFVRTTKVPFAVSIVQEHRRRERLEDRGEILGVRVGEVWCSFCCLLFLCFLLDMGDESWTKFRIYRYAPRNELV